MELFEEPEKPEASDCCNSGCNPCVLDLYEKRLKEWKNGFNQQISITKLQIRTDLLSETKLKPFRLINKFKLCPKVYCFKFQPVLCTNDKKNTDNDISQVDEAIEKNIPGILPYKLGQHIILKGYDTCFLRNSNEDNNGPEKLNYISRAYTPISVSSEIVNCCFEIVVKIFEEGKMSKFLSLMKIGDVVECRGPYGCFTYTTNSYRHILMLCIGTGIAPMYNIIKFIINNDEDETFVHLMYGAQTVNDIILRKELRQFTEYWNFKEEIYLSKECDSTELPKFGETFIYNHIDGKTIANYLSDKDVSEIFILICGTDLFCKHMELCIVELGISKNQMHIF